MTITSHEGAVWWVVVAAGLLPRIDTGQTDESEVKAGSLGAEAGGRCRVHGQ